MVITFMPIEQEQIKKATEFFNTIGMKRHGWLPASLKVALHAAVERREIDKAKLVELGERFAVIGKIDGIQPHIKQAAQIAETNPARALNTLKANIAAQTGKANAEEHYQDSVPLWARKRIELHVPSALLAELKEAYFEGKLIREPREPHNNYDQRHGGGGFFHTIAELLPPAADDSEIKTSPVVKKAIETMMQHAMHVKDPVYKASYLRNALYDITNYWYGSIYQDELKPEVEAKIKHFIARHEAKLDSAHVAPEKLGKLCYAQGVSQIRQTPNQNYLYIRTPLQTREQRKKFLDNLELHLDPAHFEIDQIAGGRQIKLKSKTPEGDEFISKVKLPDRKEKKGLRWQRTKSIAKGFAGSAMDKVFRKKRTSSRPFS